MLWIRDRADPAGQPDDPTDPAYNFQHADQIVTGLSSRGITTLLTVYSSPTWANGGKATPKSTQYNPFTPNPVQFGQFMQALAKRYSGTFAPGAYAPTLPRSGTSRSGTSPTSSCSSPQYKGKGIKNPVAAKNYSNLVKAAYPLIKSVNPQAIVIAGVTGPKSSNDASGQGTLSWLKSLAKFKPKMDAYSQHIYPAVTPNADTKAVPTWNSIGTLLAQVDKIKRGLPMYITEAGYTTARPSSARSR